MRKMVAVRVKPKEGVSEGGAGCGTLWHTSGSGHLATGIESRETAHGTRLYRARVLVLHAESGER